MSKSTFSKAECKALMAALEGLYELAMTYEASEDADHVSAIVKAEARIQEIIVGVTAKGPADEPLDEVGWLSRRIRKRAKALGVDASHTSRRESSSFSTRSRACWESSRRSSCRALTVGTR